MEHDLTVEQQAADTARIDALGRFLQRAIIFPANTPANVRRKTISDHATAREDALEAIRRIAARS